MNMTRRALLAGAPAAAAAAPSAAQALAQAAKRIISAPIAAASAGRLTNEPGSAPTNYDTPEWRALRKVLQGVRGKRANRRRYQRLGLDADIASLRLPRATQVRMQIAREEEVEGLVQLLESQLYPPDSAMRTEDAAATQEF